MVSPPRSERSFGVESVRGAIPPQRGSFLPVVTEGSITQGREGIGADDPDVAGLPSAVIPTPERHGLQFESFQLERSRAREPRSGCLSQITLPPRDEIRAGGDSRPGQESPNPPPLAPPAGSCVRPPVPAETWTQPKLERKAVVSLRWELNGERRTRCLQVRKPSENRGSSGLLSAVVNPPCSCGRASRSRGAPPPGEPAVPAGGAADENGKGHSKARSAVINSSRLLLLLVYFAILFPVSLVLLLIFHIATKRAVATLATSRGKEEDPAHPGPHPLFIFFGIFAIVVSHYIIIFVGFPANCLAIHGLCRLVKADCVSPLYVINLLAANLLQIATVPIYLASFTDQRVCSWTVVNQVNVAVFEVGLLASIGFMLCISLERYLVIARPVWHHNHNSLSFASRISLAMWGAAVLLTSIKDCLEDLDLEASPAFLLVYLAILFPVPLVLLLIFCVSTRRALVTLSTLPPEEKKRILRTLALVLFIFIGIFAPHFVLYVITVIYNLAKVDVPQGVTDCQGVLLNIRCLHPLLDPILYFLLRTDVRESLDTVSCCQGLSRLIQHWWRPGKGREGDRDTVHTLSSSIHEV
ncbi:OGR1 protein, partial [Atractosteus spatula]|nr:OGR1 protein [Atractosteus spatula]